MALNLMMTEDDELRPRITVFGVGGAGGNAVNNMIEKQLDGVEFVVANTDAQALGQSRSEKRVQMGPKVTEGLGAGAKPAIGAAAAEETIEDIVDHLMGAHMCFITAGMGGGTGTGAAPIIAQAAREMGILTVGVVTKPFAFEGTRRMRQADAGIEALQKVVDTLIIIPNQNLFRLANERTTFTEAFALADDVLYQGVKGVTDLMVRPGLINLDFADVRAVMDEMGKAMMGTGEADGENRAVEAAEKAIANPLLDEISLTGAKGVLINITGGHDLTLFELDEAANIIRDKVDPDANIIVGSTLDEGMEGALRVSVVATGIEMSADEAAPPRRESAQVAVVAASPTASPAAAARTASPADDGVPARRTAPNPGPNPAAQPSAQQTATPARGDEAQHPARASGDATGSSMPAPAYAPRPAASALREQRLNDPATDFTAPMPGQGATEAGSAGAPRRLTDLAAKGGLGTAAGSTGNAAAPASRGEAGSSGLAGGLGRIIGRMAHSAQDSHAGRPSASTVAERVSERVASNRARQDGFDDLADPDQGRDVTEVPAFLRRQAN